MNGSKDNNGRRDWKAIYAQWDRDRLEEELVRNADRIRRMRDEQSQLQSRVRQLEEENRVQAAELRRLGITNQVFAEAVVALKDQGEQEGEEGAVAKLEPLRQNSGRFQVSPAEVMYPDPMPSQGFSEGVEASMLEQERREARREPVRDYEGSEGMQVARAEMARRAARRQEQHRKWYEKDSGLWG